MSNQDDKMIEKKRQAVRSILGLYGRIARHYCPANSVVDAGVAILDELIRSHTAPRELVEAVSNLSDIVDEQKADDSLWCEETNIVTAYFQQELKRLHLFCDALRAALSVQEPKVCEWVDDDPFWIISCQKVGLSHSFHEPVIVRKWKACPYCTNPIEVKESDVRQGGKG